MLEIETVDVPPDVARVSEGLRDTGYIINTAVADIIDNSIAAGASTVDVRIGVDFLGGIAVSFADNGCGMDRSGLINAMRYGSSKREDSASLGKFGLGLKTASTAFCRRLIVVSRDGGSMQPLRAVWDLDEMSSANSWALEIGQPEPHETQLLEAVAINSAGTVVIWEKVDRLFSELKRPDGKPLKNALRRLEESLREHIGTVYQRFLDHDDDRSHTVEIRLNGVVVAPWDPFCLAQTKKPVVDRSVAVQLTNGETASFTVRAFILPRKEEFPDDAGRAAAKISNERQGVYVYRENRLIHGPDWLGMYKQEPHFSLLRVELSFDHRLDDAFQVDIKKSRILLNENLYEWLRDTFLAAPRREAEIRYRKGAAGVAKGAATLIHTNSDNAIQQKVRALKLATVSETAAGNGQVEVTNNAGHSTTTLRIVTSDDLGLVHISTADALDNGVLWEMSLVNGGAGVTLNTGHPYYSKAYLPNKSNSTVVQALDFLLWALAQAELNNVSDENRDAFEEFRIEVSRNLKKLVADLPDYVEGDSSNDNA
ncbi:hypothetical protein OKW43_002759 [Paraburkholderia sp. WC7.3g]|uniref:ATP-binding protein n=1 Tax=Paraburkholderia sp. WC7.3g TaxID=2991070 RepID=UPI003D19CD9F